MTEDEAKTKWCPFARVGRLVEGEEWPGAAINRAFSIAHGTGLGPSLCIASACMAWRWANEYERRWDLPADKAPEGEGWDRVEAIGGVAHWVRQSQTPNGFCGLARRPQ